MRLPWRYDPYLEWTAAVLTAAAGFALAYHIERQGLARGGRPSKRDDGAAFANRTRAPTVTQVARATEVDRGRQAVSPVAIPWRGWKDILWRTYAEIQDDRLLALAAGVVFYALLALFPAVTAGVSLYGLFADASTISQHLSLASGIIPGGALDIVGEQIGRIVAKGGGNLTFGFVLGLGLALWSANAGMKAVFDALNIINDEDEKRGFFRLNLVSLAFTAAAIVMALLLVAGVVAVPLLLAGFGVGSRADALLVYLRWPAMFLLALVSMSMLYRYGPSRQPARWRWLSVGSVVGALTWLAVSSAFSFYLSNFGNYDATYGSLGAGIGLMMWLWLSAIVVLVGAELNAEIEHQTARDSTTGAPQPLGGRGAVMADTLGRAKA